MVTRVELELSDPGGNRVDLWRALVSHGIASLPPMFLDEGARRLEVTVALRRGLPRTIVIREGRAGRAVIDVLGRSPGPRVVTDVVATVRHMLRLDEDMSGFYAQAAGDPGLAWVTSGAGRMLRSPTVFEEVVKTICTTNCSWSLTRRMVDALVGHLGEPAAGAPPQGPRGRAFPTPRAMAEESETFYRNVVRAGYRGPYLRSLARSVASGEIDLESLRCSRDGGLVEDEVADRLLSLPGVGPYAAAHVMMMLGCYSRLILDSWTRPTYARLIGKRTVSDTGIARRFRRYGRYAGLAFWLFCTRDWVEEPEEQQADAFSQTSG
jgi:3-methyladenine DNA glycosylase/8-oxoguanine DNA glycosylase